MSGRAMSSEDRADWNVAIIDGEPQEIVNAAGVADLVRKSPLGVNEAMRRLRQTLTPEVFKLVEAEVKAA